MATDIDEDRWADAQSILDGTPTESAARRLRRSKRRWWLLILGITVLVNSVGLWIATPPTWRLVLIGVFVPVVLVAVVLSRRETQRAQRFLDAHPAPPQDASAA